MLELAEALARGKRPQRTIIFAWFGSEETGGAGATHFIEAPPVPLDTIVANLEFEMIGRADQERTAAHAVVDRIRTKQPRSRRSRSAGRKSSPIRTRSRTSSRDPTTFSSPGGA